MANWKRNRKKRKKYKYSNGPGGVDCFCCLELTYSTNSLKTKKYQDIKRLSTAINQIRELKYEGQS